MRVEVRYAYVASLHPTISEKNLELLFAAHVLKAKQFFFGKKIHQLSTITVSPPESGPSMEPTK